MPANLVTVGDHLRAKRIRNRLEQAELAKRFGVTAGTVWNWENGRSPSVPRCAAIIEFLGYDPFPEPRTFAERLVVFRRRRGLRVKDAAALASVDPASWTSWENGWHSITPAYSKRLEELIGGG